MESLTPDEMVEMSEDGCRSLEESPNAPESMKAVVGMVSSLWLMTAQLAARLDALLAALVAQQPAPAAPARPPGRPGVIQPEPRDPAKDAALDASSPGGGGAAVVRPEPEGGR